LFFDKEIKMKLVKSFLFFSISFSLFSIAFPSFTIQTVFAQDSRIAIQRGYRTGYSDGYMSGYRDAIENATKNYARHSEYATADRAFSKDYGSIEDYRDGYQQGFESGYDTGFEKRSFDATVPINLNKRGIIAVQTTAVENTTTPTVAETVEPKKIEEPIVTNKVEETIPENTSTAATTSTVEQPVITTTNSSDSNEIPPVISTRTDNVNSAVSGETIISIPSDTELILELLEDIDTERSKEGDRFKARIISPNELNGAIIEGRVSKINKPGRIKRRAEMLLSFDRVVLSEQRWSNFSAILTEVLPRKGDNVKRIDTEGTVEGKSTVKSDSIKVGATTGTGLVIGAIAGGPVGAAVGAGVGAAFGVGAVVVERGKHIRLNKDQQLRIKSSYETQIR
jgi:hypothetical protein